MGKHGDDGRILTCVGWVAANSLVIRPRRHKMAPPDGVEPPFAGSEPAVLPLNEGGVLVGAARLELAASWSQARRSTMLSYTPY